MELIMSICLGIGLSAATGFRIFIPALLANVAAMNGFINPGESFSWIASWPAFWVLATASTLEIGAYYIPLIDNLLDTIATPVAWIAGTLLTTSFVQIDNPVLLWGLGIILGGGTAGLIQTGTTMTRLASVGTTGGLANPVVSTGENVAAFSIAAFAIFLPVIGFIVVILIFWYFRKKWRKVRPQSWDR